MAISTYAELQAHITSIMARADLTTLIPDWIFLVEQELDTVLHRREMTVRATSNTVAGTDTYALPTDFGDAMALHLNGDPIEVLEPADFSRIRLAFNDQEGQPTHWAITANEFLLGPTPDAVYQLELYYYKTIPNLGGATTTNWLLTSYPAVYVYGALTEAATSRLADDPSAQKWALRYQEALRILKRDQIREAGFGGGPKLQLPAGLGGGVRSSILTG